MRCDEHIHIRYWAVAADIVAGHIDSAAVGIATGRIDMLAAVIDSLLLAVADLIAGHMAVAAAVALAIAVAGMAEVMHSVSEGLEAGCMATEGVAVARGMAPGALKHQGIQARLLDPLMLVEKICSYFDKLVTARSKTGSWD